MSTFTVGHWLVVGVIVFLGYPFLRGFLGALVGRRSAPPQVVPGADAEYRVWAVGESHYRPALRKVLGALADTEDEMYTPATLALDNANAHDPQAVKVLVQGTPVAYLSKDDARRFRRTYARQIAAGTRVWEVPARIYGGGDEELYSVALAVPGM